MSLDLRYQRRFGLAWFGLAWFVLAWFGLAWARAMVLGPALAHGPWPGPILGHFGPNPKLLRKMRARNMFCHFWFKIDPKSTKNARVACHVFPGRAFFRKKKETAPHPKHMGCFEPAMLGTARNYREKLSPEHVWSFLDR